MFPNAYLENLEMYQNGIPEFSLMLCHNTTANKFEMHGFNQVEDVIISQVYAKQDIKEN